MLLKEELDQKKEMIFEYIASEAYTPVKFKEMAGILQVPKREKEDFRLVIDTLVTEGRIQIDSRGLIRAAAGNVKKGVYSGTSRGFGFVTVPGEKEDIFIPEDASKGALHGDTVQIEILDEKRENERKAGCWRLSSVVLHR